MEWCAQDFLISSTCICNAEQNSRKEQAGSLCGPNMVVNVRRSLDTHSSIIIYHGPAARVLSVSSRPRFTGSPSGQGKHGASWKLMGPIRHEVQVLLQKITEEQVPRFDMWFRVPADNALADLPVVGDRYISLLGDRRKSQWGQPSLWFDILDDYMNQYYGVPMLTDTEKRNRFNFDTTTLDLGSPSCTAAHYPTGSH